MPQIKEQILRALQDLPDGAGYEEAIERVYLLYKISRGIEQADRGDLLTQDAARQRMARWLR